MNRRGPINRRELNSVLGFLVLILLTFVGGEFYDRVVDRPLSHIKPSGKTKTVTEQAPAVEPGRAPSEEDRLAQKTDTVSALNKSETEMQDELRSKDFQGKGIDLVGDTFLNSDNFKTKILALKALQRSQDKAAANSKLISLFQSAKPQDEKELILSYLHPTDAASEVSA
jgi:hypothetical protein